MYRPSPPTVAVTLALVAVLAVAVGLTAGLVPADSAADSPSTVETGDEESATLQSPTAAVTDGDPPYLAPPPETVTREEYAQPGIDISAAAASDAQQLRGQFRATAFELQFDNTENRTGFTEAFVDDIGARTEALDDYHAQLIDEYRTEQRSTQSLLRELVRLEAAVAQQQRLANRVETTVVEADGVSPSQDIQELSNVLNVEIPALESPVTDTFLDGGFEPGTAVYAQAGAEGIVLAAPNSDRIVRQATLRSQRNRSDTNQFLEEAGEDENPLSLAAERARTLYGDDNVIGFFPPPFGATTVYGIQGTVVGGSFTAYLDGTTRNIFHEKQTVTADSVPVTSTLNDRLGTVELTVNTTVPTGPMRVSVTDSGDPVEGATVQVANQTAGTTDASGQRWIVQPLGGAEVSVTVDDLTVSVTLP